MSTVVLSLDTKHWSVLLASDIGLDDLMHKAIWYFFLRFITRASTAATDRKDEYGRQRSLHVIINVNRSTL
jgi:hypothetical protein